MLDQPRITDVDLLDGGIEGHVELFPPPIHLCFSTENDMWAQHDVISSRNISLRLPQCISLVSLSRISRLPLNPIMEAAAVLDAFSAAPRHQLRPAAWWRSTHLASQACHATAPFARADWQTACAILASNSTGGGGQDASSKAAAGGGR